MVAFDRFLARVAKKQPDAWIVKGGFALQLRLGKRARTTKDIDVSAVNPWTREQTITNLRAAVLLNLGDWFEFEVGEPAEAATGAPGRGFRFPIRCLLDSRPFETFHLDVQPGHGALYGIRPEPRRLLSEYRRAVGTSIRQRERFRSRAHSVLYRRAG